MTVDTLRFGPGFRHDPFYSGGATSILAPAWMPVAIAGHTYLLDPAKYARQTLPIIRQQSDTSAEPGEHSLNPAGLWRRSQETWHHGAGQPFYDGRVGRNAYSQIMQDPEQYRSSKGIDPWTRGQLSLLPSTSVRHASVNTNMYLAVAGAYLYLADGNELYWSTDGTTWNGTNVAGVQAGQAAEPISALATDGYHVWAALGSSGIHRTDRGATTSTPDVPVTAATLVAWAMGRLLAANGPVLYEITDPLGTPAATVLHTHPNVDFTWDFVTPGRNVIYAGGSSGGTSEIYRITIEATTTALAAPVFATYLPDGERCSTLQFYAGQVILATDKGLRLATAATDGSLDYGPLVDIPGGVTALEPQGRYCWFGWANYDDVSTGLGRADLGFLTDNLVPAYASDLMVTGQGAPTAVATFADQRYLAVSGLGLYGEDATRVETGTIEPGAIRYTTTDNKTTRSVDLRHHALAGTVDVDIKIDGADWIPLGGSAVAGTSGPSTPLSTRSLAGETIELRFTLTRDAVITTVGPELVRWTLRALPTPRRDEQFSLPIWMKPEVSNMVGDGQPVTIDVPAEIAFLKDIEGTGRIVTLQIGEEAYSVFIDHMTFEGEAWESQSGWRRYLQGLLTVVCQTCNE